MNERFRQCLEGLAGHLRSHFKTEKARERLYAVLRSWWKLAHPIRAWHLCKGRADDD